MSACDVSVYGNHEISHFEIHTAESIFCPSEKIEKFLAEYGDLISAKTLVFGNTDRDFYDLNDNFPRSVKSVYLQNSHISDGFFQTLPIGIENLRYGRNGLPALFRPPHSTRVKKDKILVGPFSPTHKDRLELNSWSTINDSRIHFESTQYLPKQLASLASDFKYVACPRGNGTDTHRFWETLYRGSIPVVRRSLWSKSISDLGIPLVEISDWDFQEFLYVSEQLSLQSFNPNDISLLWMNHWLKVFNSWID